MVTILIACISLKATLRRCFAIIKAFYEYFSLVYHFKRVYMSCVSKSLSSQVNLYFHVVTTGNANATNEALTIRRVCTAIQKYARPCWWMYNRLYRHFVEGFRNSIVWWDGVSGKTPDFPWLLQVGIRKDIQL